MCLPRLNKRQRRIFMKLGDQGDEVRCLKAAREVSLLDLKFCVCQDDDSLRGWRFGNTCPGLGILEKMIKERVCENEGGVWGWEDLKSYGRGERVCRSLMQSELSYRHRLCVNAAYEHLATDVAGSRDAAISEIARMSLVSVDVEPSYLNSVSGGSRKRFRRAFGMRNNA
ncbi:gamma-aminobutyric acid receptor alpha-like protein [Tanacetum coccineum]